MDNIRISVENKKRCICYLQGMKINTTVWNEEASLDCENSRCLNFRWSTLTVYNVAPLVQTAHVNTLMGAKTQRYLISVQKM